MPGPHIKRPKLPDKINLIGLAPGDHSQGEAGINFRRSARSMFHNMNV